MSLIKIELWPQMKKGGKGGLSVERKARPVWPVRFYQNVQMHFTLLL